MMKLYDVTMLCIENESTITELEALSERIDVMFLVGNKFEMEDYVKLSEAVSKKIEDLKALEATDPDGDGTDVTEETPVTEKTV